MDFSLRTVGFTVANIIFGFIIGLFVGLIPYMFGGPALFGAWGNFLFFGIGLIVSVSLNTKDGKMHPFWKK